MFGSRTTPPQPATPQASELEVKYARLTAAVDQVLAVVAEAQRSNGANRQLVDVTLDVQLVLTKAIEENAKVGRHRG